ELLLGALGMRERGPPPGHQPLVMDAELRKAEVLAIVRPARHRLVVAGIDPGLGVLDLGEVDDGRMTLGAHVILHDGGASSLAFMPSATRSAATRRRLFSRTRTKASYISPIVSGSSRHER